MNFHHNKTLTGRARELRTEMTKEERRLWYGFLRRYPVKFRRQEIFGRFIVDFYCARAGLVIEADGSQHYEPDGMARDAERTAYLEGLGLTVFRIANNEINANFDGVCVTIDRLVKALLHA